MRKMMRYQLWIVLLAFGLTLTLLNSDVPLHE